jgi:hypothetical protein
MRALLIASAALLITQATAVCGQAAGEMRMLIAPNAAIDGPTYDQYQACLARIALNQDLKAVSAAREACKAKALDAAYRVPPKTVQDAAQAANGVPTAQDRRNAQVQKLERLKP